MDSEIPMNRPEQRTGTPSERQVIGPAGRRSVAYVPCDFSQEELTEALRRPRPLVLMDADDEPWREAVINQCAIACLDGDFTDPRATLERLITWHVQMALDPKISEAAAGLVLAAKVEALEWAATQCAEEAYIAAAQARQGGTAFDDGREQAARTLAIEIRAGKGYTS